MYPNLVTSCKTLLTVPVIAASMGRPFSKWNIIKNYLKSWCSLTSPLVMSIENKIAKSVNFAQYTNLQESGPEKSHDQVITLMKY